MPQAEQRTDIPPSDQQLWIILLSSTKSLGRPYMWPLFPLHLRSLLDIIIRSPIQLINKRPNIVRPQDKDRQPN